MRRLDNAPLDRDIKTLERKVASVKCGRTQLTTSTNALDM